ncbi:MAG: glycosyltransferase family 39 protein [Oscillospiraceae bacterium]|nr:glycosyltransferase family 39 protein [Oscillospiraceae bacterium]
MKNHLQPAGTKERPLECAAVTAVLLLYFLLQLPTLYNAAWEGYNSWRQSDTYSIAVNYIQYNMNPLRPQFNYDGVSDIYVQLELQIMTYLSALIFKCTGVVTPFVPRLTGMLFFLGSARFVYLILRRFVWFGPAAVGLLVYLFLPISMVYARAVMPESCALFFYCGGVWFLLRWYEDGHQPSIFLSALFTAIAIMEKTPVIFVGLLILAVFVWKLKWKCLKAKEFYLYGLISLGLPLAYYLYASSVATVSFVDGIAAKHILTKELVTAVFSPAAVSFFRSSLPEFFGWMPLIAALLGLAVSVYRKTGFITVWTIAFLAEWATIVAIIRFGYYLVFMAPVVAVLCALLCSEIFSRQAIAGAVCGLLLTVLVIRSGIPYWQAAVKEVPSIQAAADLIDAVTEPEDVLAISDGNPVYLNAANRHGFRANLQYYDEIPVGAGAETQYYIAQGVSWFVVIGQSIQQDPGGEYLEYIKNTFPAAAENEFCTIYKMR